MSKLNLIVCTIVSVSFLLLSHLPATPVYAQEKTAEIPDPGLPAIHSPKQTSDLAQGAKIKVLHQSKDKERRDYE